MDVLLVLVVVSFKYRTGMPIADDGGNGADVLQGSPVSHSRRGKSAHNLSCSWSCSLCIALARFLILLLLPILLSPILLLPILLVLLFLLVLSLYFARVVIYLAIALSCYRSLASPRSCYSFYLVACATALICSCCYPLLLLLYLALAFAAAQTCSCYDTASALVFAMILLLPLFLLLVYLAPTLALALPCAFS